MRFLRLETQNFLSFGAPGCYIEFDHKGLTLIEGINYDKAGAQSNGSGKSAIPEALLWGLYGVTLRGYSADEVINRKVGRDCYVRIGFTDGTTQYQVTRHRKSTHFKNQLHLLIDSTEATCASAAATQEKINELLGMNATTFAHTVIFGQSVAYRFSTLTDKEQKEIFDQVLGMEQYKAACDAARVKVNELQRSLDRTEADLAHARSRRTELLADIAQLKDKEANFDKDKREALAQEHTTLKELQAGILVLDEQLKQTAIKAAKAEEVLVEVNALDSKVRARTYAVNKYDVLRQNALDELTALTEARDEAAEVRGTCDTCGQEITAASVKQHTHKLNEQIAVKTALLASRKKEYTTAVAGVTRAQRALDQKNTEYVELYPVHTDCVLLKARHQTTKERIADKQANIKIITQRKSPYAEMIAKARMDAAAARKSAATHKASCAQIIRKQKQYEFWVEAFGARGLRSLLIDNALPFLNERVQKYADILADGSLDIEFKTQSVLKSGKTVEKFEVSVQNKHGAESYAGNSSGEKAKIDLCVGLALQALVASSAKVNVAFFDEPFESLDGEATERVITLLTDALASRDSVFVITHNEALKSYFPDSITVEKRDGISGIR